MYGAFERGYRLNRLALSTTHHLHVARLMRKTNIIGPVYNDCAVVCTMWHRERTRVERNSESITFCAILTAL